MSKDKHSDNRPTSPHITIYKPQISSVLSITHRVTGALLFLGVLVFAWKVVFAVYGCDRCFSLLFATDIGKAVMVLWTLIFFYHLLNGIRHLFWDIGKGYEIKTMTWSGIAVLVGTVVLTLAVWFAGLF